MPRSLLLSAILFIVAGIACLLCEVFFNFSSTPPLWIGILSLAAGIGLFLGLHWGRILASVMIFFGYVAATLYLISATLPPREGTAEIWGVYGGVFLGVAILTMVSGFLWNRSASTYINRFSNAAKPEKT